MAEVALVKLPSVCLSLDLTDDKSTLVQVMAWCHQATSHYLSQCWPRSVSPYGVTYCNHVWGNAYDSNLYPLVMLQKRIIRIITLSKYLDHTGPLFKELGLLKIGEINKYLLGKFMYKWSNSRVPLLFQDMFQYVRNVHGYGTRQSDHLYTPIVKTNLGKCSLRYKGPVIWNSILTAHINPDTSEAVFAKTLEHCIVIGIT